MTAALIIFLLLFVGVVCRLHVVQRCQQLTSEQEQELDDEMRIW